MIHFQETQYGFEYGSLAVTRVASDEKRQWVIVGLGTPKGLIHVYATKTGKIRVFRDNEELH